MASKLKNVIIFLVIGAAMIAGYLYFFSGEKPIASLVTEDGTSATGNIVTGDTTPTEQDFLPVLLNVKRIRLDDAIFSDPAFLTLHDSSITLIPDGNEGRPNPFAPISATNTNTSFVGGGGTVSGTNIPQSAEAASAANTIDITTNGPAFPPPTNVPTEGGIFSN